MINKIIEENLAYQSKLDMEEVKSRLYKVFRENRSTALYEGEITGNKFQMSRLIRYRNSFLPKISGEFTSNSTGTFLRVNMKLPTFVSVFLTIWILGFMSLNFYKFFGGTYEGLEWQFKIIPMAGIIIPWATFKFETAKTKKFIENILETVTVS